MTIVWKIMQTVSVCVCAKGLVSRTQTHLHTWHPQCSSRTKYCTGDTFCVVHATCHPCLEELTCGPCGSRCSHQARDERGTPCWAMVLLQWFVPYWIPWIPFIQFQQTWQWTDIWNIHEHTSLGLPLWISLIPDVFGGWRRTFGRTYSKRNYFVERSG